MFIRILGNIMRVCYNIFNNYGLAIILFTIISKVVLLPLSILIQKDSIKMVKMQPAINKIKINYFGDKDKIAEEQAKLFKEEKYNALTSLIPLVVQIVLLLGLVSVINHPLTHILKMDKNVVEGLTTEVVNHNKNLSIESSSLEIDVVKEIKNNKNIEKYKDIIDENQIQDIKKINFNFLGFDLSWIAASEKGLAILIPLIAGISALILCIGQNKMNVLQVEQSNFNKYGMLIISVGLSLYLGSFVVAGVALYWTISNILAVIQQWILNIFINPKKFVDYEALEKTNKELEFLNKKSSKRSIEQIRKEKQDYKKFFSIVNKHLVFYSESNGFYKYYKGIIEYLLKNTNITIHYITSDYNDNIFKLEKDNNQIKAYYIEEKKLITLMMKMDCDVVVMTMPDLQNYHIKRSYVRKDIEYIYIPHCMDSMNLTMRKGSIDHFDTIFVTNKYQEEEETKANLVHHLNRKIVKWGYTLLDDMINDYNHNKKLNKQKTVLIAPSWQKDNIVDLCLDDILNNLKNTDYKIIVRPHPQHVRHMKEKFEQLKEQYKDNKNIVIQTDFSSNDTVFNADLMISDWSAIAHEYAYTTKKPVLFIDTPMKIMNPDYKDLNIEPINIWSREKIGKVVKAKEINKISKTINEMLNNNDKYKDKITKLVDESVYNLGISDKIGAEYIIKTIQDKIKERSKK